MLNYSGDLGLNRLTARELQELALWQDWLQKFYRDVPARRLLALTIVEHTATLLQYVEADVCRTLASSHCLLVFEDYITEHSEVFTEGDVTQCFLAETIFNPFSSAMRASLSPLLTAIPQKAEVRVLNDARQLAAIVHEMQGAPTNPDHFLHTHLLTEPGFSLAGRLCEGAR